jgi:hypothetical protein
LLVISLIRDLDLRKIKIQSSDPRPAVSGL